MKNIFIFCLLITFSALADAQNNLLGFGGGVSAFNSKTISLNYETRINDRNYLGFFAETFFYSDQKKPFTLHSDQSHYYVGLYYKPLMSASRNFSNYFLFGAAAGTHNRKFLYYPFAGFEQHFYIGDKTIFFIGEELKYLVPLTNKWQPFIKTGLKLSLR